jgi:hypothetical protein
LACRHKGKYRLGVNNKLVEPGQPIAKPYQPPVG